MAARLLRRLVAALVGSGLALSVLLVPASPAGAAPSCSDPVICPSSVYFGASLPGLPRDLAGLQAFGTDVARQPTIANYFAAFGDQLDRTGLTALADAHRLPMLTWSPDVRGNTGANPYPLTAIASGAFDTYLIAQAKALAAVPGHVAVRFAHEMNAGWFPWGRGVNGNTDAQYVAAYRHVHDVVTAAGATNVIWMWSPAVVAGAASPGSSGSLGSLYPGSAYVDWVAPDLYLPNATDTFAALWNPVQADLNTFAADKPLVFAETGVAPGPTRPAQIADLVGGLLHTPRLAGIVWFEESGTKDWRVDADPAGRSALAAQLATPWVSVPGASGTTALPPLYQSVPVTTGTPRVGAAVSATPGTWRAGLAAAPTVTGHWYRCTTPTDTTSCTAVTGAGAGYTVQRADWHDYLRYREHATNAAGSADAWSNATAAVQMTPDAPAAPTVTAVGGALQVSFPPAPFGATHWLLSLDGKQMVPIPVATSTYWLLNLINGGSYQVQLSAADVAGTSTVVSQPVSLTAVPMAGPSTPYLVVTGGTAVFQLPRVPTGAQAWLLTLDGTTTTLPVTGTTWTSSTVLRPGTTHTWSLAPAAGSGGVAGWGSAGSASSGSFVALDAPVVPTVVPVRGGATFTFPALPAGATGWQLTVGPTTYPVTGASTMTVTGLASGYSASWSLRAVNAAARSLSVTGRFLPA
ncbi:glycoside hydrolase family 26 protein [uncultured Jatrophihabitans sp.]|uniref:glycoside hydrolase family 26 protein n=1 Tax=uncultured Jatrophihabitans sp. TaxID=1610747 RepID=UPI0035CAA001